MMKYNIFLIVLSCFLLSFKEKPCLVFEDKTSICAVDIFPSEKTPQIHKISYENKTFLATISEGCFKGHQFFLDPEIAKHLDPKIKRKFYDNYSKNKREYTAFVFHQNGNTFSLNVSDKTFINRYCMNEKLLKVKASAVIFTLHTKEKRKYHHIIIKKVEEVL